MYHKSELRVNSKVTPRALLCWNLPFALQEGVKRELIRLEENGVLAPVKEPTESLSEITVVKKPDGSHSIE